MEWNDYDFVLPSAEQRSEAPPELTGWEVVVFEIEDDDDDPAKT